MITQETSCRSRCSRG